MLTTLNNKKILLGITGGIATYKACELVRLFKKNGALVKVIMTQAATEFVRPLTFATLSENKVYQELFLSDRESVEHISLARWADCIVVAPATANCIAKLANGIADDLLSTILVAANTPICIAPAMNKEMWGNQATQTNIKVLLNRNIEILWPACGHQACGEVGDGRMLEPNEIAALTATLFYPPLLQGKKIIVTAGPTVEPIDPVRYISNRSSGKMGYAVAEAATKFGANVILISGPTHLQTPARVARKNVKTALEMRDAVMAEISNCDIFISVAAIADYRIKTPSLEKIKKMAETMQLGLVKNPDVLEEVAKLSPAPLTVGFAAETCDVLAHARKKLKHKNIDIIVANKVGEDLGFEKEDNSITIITKNGQETEIEQKSKTILAIDLIKTISEYVPNLSQRKK
jgi:phosphopantothenoylcysteine decarboxylase/phosphopantothenate--cysteine ligase